MYYNGKRFGGEGHGGRAFLALRVGAGVKEASGFSVSPSQIYKRRSDEVESVPKAARS